MMPFTPSSSAPMVLPVEDVLSPVEEVLGSPTLHISSENKRFARGDHAKLLSELTRIRHLYEESIQQQVKEANGPQKCLSRACQYQHLQQEHIVKFPFKVLDESVRKEGFVNNTGSLLLENRHMNRLSILSSTPDLRMDSTRENRNEENRDESGPSMKLAHAPCVCNDLKRLIPSSQSLMMAPACVEIGREPLSLLNENYRLRRDNAVLLSELTHVRKLYNDALLIIEIQKSHLEEANHPSGLKMINSESRDMQGPFFDSSATPSLSRADIVQHKRDFADSPSFENDAYHDAKKLRGYQDGCELMRQPATMDITGEKTSSKQSGNEEVKEPIRLFGVPLQCSKKRQHEEVVNGIANTDMDDDEFMIIKVVTADHQALEKMPSLKSIDSLEQIE